MSGVRRMLSRDFVNALWQSSDGKPRQDQMPCPLCGNGLSGVSGLLPGADGHDVLALDVCRTCPAVWFDTRELETAARSVPHPPPPAGPPELPAKAREILALAEIERIRERAEEEDAQHGRPPAEGWQAILTIFGVPVEENAPSLSRWPWVTWGTVLLMALVTLWGLYFEPSLLRDGGLIPADPWRHGGLTLVSSFFLHAGLMHLFVNAAFLLIFGDNSEDYLGHWLFLLLLVGSALTGDLVHGLLDPRGDVPLVGASGGISGVLAFYALRFPRARLVTMIRAWMYIRWIRFSALTGFLVWLGMQAFGVYLQTGQFSMVSSLAHVGGAFFGILFWFAGWLWSAADPREPRAV